MIGKIINFRLSLLFGLFCCFPALIVTIFSYLMPTQIRHIGYDANCFIIYAFKNWIRQFTEITFIIVIVANVSSCKLQYYFFKID